MRNDLAQRFPKCGPRTPGGPWRPDRGSAGDYCVDFYIQSLQKICS